MKLTLNDNIKIKLNPGETLLDAALREGHYLPYSCKLGRCKSCAMTLLDGETTIKNAQIGLSKEELSSGSILSCCHIASSDVIAKVERILSVAPPEVVVTPSKISQIDTLSDGVVKVKLRFPPNTPFKTYFSGQYIKIRRNGGPWRSYSIANSQRQDGTIDLIIGQVEGGIMSQYWFKEAKPNDILTVSAPHGSFILESIDQKRLVFVATGTGIAPILSFLEQIDILPDAKKPESVTVVWGIRKLEDMYWTPSGYKFVDRFIPVFSRESADIENAYSGYVQDVVKLESLAGSGQIIYACGSQPMLTELEKTASNLGGNPNEFIADSFVASD